MTDPNDKFLFVAYTLVWIVFMLYAWNLARRQSRLRHDLDDLRKSQNLKDHPPVPKA
ncbi:MAG TPA: CcmD family protein [Terriglobia bacterium]|nr:CcmD family protein [Terriglobia bacterium]